MGLRETINEKPVFGWAVAAILGGVAVFFVMRALYGGGDVHSVSAMKEMVTIRCVETGDTWVMERGQLEKELYQRAYMGPLDPNVGLVNPSTGEPTGFPELRGGWQDTIRRINEEVQEAKSKTGR